MFQFLHRKKIHGCSLKKMALKLIPVYRIVGYVSHIISQYIAYIPIMSPCLTTVDHCLATIQPL